VDCSNNAYPTSQPTSHPTMQPSNHPTSKPSRQPSSHPTSKPTRQPTRRPSSQPSGQPSRHPTRQPSGQPTGHPSWQPTLQPSLQPTSRPTTDHLRHYLNYGEIAAIVILTICCVPLIFGVCCYILLKAYRFNSFGKWNFGPQAEASAIPDQNVVETSTNAADNAI